MTYTAGTGSRAYGNYDVVTTLFVGLLLISNVGATKLIQFDLPFALPVIGPAVITDGGALLFPLTYVLGDVLAEVYGLRRARRAIILGFVLAAVASLTFLAVAAAPPADGWPHQEAWQSVLGFVPRIVAASLLGYLAGQFLNAYVLVRLKRATNGRGLAGRLVGSTAVGQLADTAVFCTVAFGGTITGSQLLNYIAVGYIYKVLVEVVLLPITYAVIGAVKRREPDLAADPLVEQRVS